MKTFAPIVLTPLLMVALGNPSDPPSDPANPAGDLLSSVQQAASQTFAQASPKPDRQERRSPAERPPSDRRQDDTRETSPESKPAEPEEEKSDLEPTRFNKATGLIGMPVMNLHSEKLGEVKDIVFDVDNGRISYLVFSSGGVLGLGEKLLAVPLTAFIRSDDKGLLQLDAEKSRVERARGLGESWPLVRNPSFESTPFWKTPGDSGPGGAAPESGIKEKESEARQEKDEGGSGKD
jgi:sporulation protein YlmC with PRC-barrel domain